MLNTIKVTFTILLSLFLAACMQDLRTVSYEEQLALQVADQKQFYKIIDQSVLVYSAITKGPHGEVPKQVLQRANCIAILPNVMTGALIVGGTHGRGLVSCKTQANKWSQPSAISLNQGSLGLQAGAKSTDLVLFLQNSAAVKALKNGNLKLGANISAVAGSFDSRVATSPTGVIVYARTAGIFAGASVNGSTISKDEIELNEFYGSKIDHQALLNGRESKAHLDHTKKLTNLFP